MGCSGCSTGRGTNNLPGGCKNNGGCDSGGCNKLNVFDWLSNMNNPSICNEAIVLGIDESENKCYAFQSSNKCYLDHINGEQYDYFNINNIN